MWQRRVFSGAAWLVASLCWLAADPASAAANVLADAAGAADAMAVPLTNTAGDPARGRAIIIDRQQGFCLLCHTASFADARQQGNLAPPLDGAGQRWSVAQLRARIIDSRAILPQTIMPSYFKVDPAPSVAASHRGKTILSAQQVEDVVAFLATLK